MCWRDDQDLEPIAEEGGESEINEYECFDDYADAMYFATDGQIDLPKGSPQADIESEMASKWGTIYILAVDYSGKNCSGDTFTWKAKGKCTWLKPWGYGKKYMYSGWDNRVSSSMAYSGCNRNYFYEHKSFGGASLRRNGVNTCQDMSSAMDNQTSSRKVKP